MFSTFTAIFDALTDIEKELDRDISEPKRDELIETLMSLRGTMDKCVQYWLKFEERVNEIQERHAITLPDTLPPGFLEEVEMSGTATSDYVVDDDLDKEPGEEVKKGLEEEFHIPSSEITVNSFRRGLGFWELAMLKEAVDEFKKVVDEEPNLIMGHFCLGLSSAQLGKIEEAFKELNLVLALDENQQMRALALNTLGILLASKEHYKQAKHFFNKATEADSSLYEAWFNLGAVSFNQQSYEEAVEAFSKAKELAEEDWEIELHLGRSLGYLSRFEEAVKFLERAYRLNSREPLITFELGLVYRILGKKNQAQCYFHSTLKLLESKA